MASPATSSATKPPPSRRYPGWTGCPRRPSARAFEQRFTARRMAEDYVALYRRLALRTPPGAACRHLTRGGRPHLTRGGRHLTRGGRHLTRGGRHLTRGGRHLTRGGRHLTRGGRHLTRGGRHLTRGGRHLTRGDPSPDAGLSKPTPFRLTAGLENQPGNRGATSWSRPRNTTSSSSAPGRPAVCWPTGSAPTPPPGSCCWKPAARIPIHGSTSPPGSTATSTTRRSPGISRPNRCRSLHNRRISWPRGKVLGGSSSINGLIYIRGQRQDFDLWRQLGNAGWSYDDVLPYFRKAEDQERRRQRFSWRRRPAGRVRA